MIIYITQDLSRSRSRLSHKYMYIRASEETQSSRARDYYMYIYIYFNAPLFFYTQKPRTPETRTWRTHAERLPGERPRQVAVACTSATLPHSCERSCGRYREGERERGQRTRCSELWLCGVCNASETGKCASTRCARERERCNTIYVGVFCARRRCRFGCVLIDVPLTVVQVYYNTDSIVGMWWDIMRGHSAAEFLSYR